MRANYGYSDACGDFYITIDTERCDGCGECVKACPNGIFEVVPDDYDELKAAVRREFAKNLSYVCPGYHGKCAAERTNCHSACASRAIEHTW